MITTEEVAVGLNLFPVCRVFLSYRPADWMTLEQIACRSNRVDWQAQRALEYFDPWGMNYDSLKVALQPIEAQDVIAQPAVA